IGPYLVFANPEALNMQSLAADVQEVDLRPDGAGSVRLKLTTSRQASIQGKVTGVENEWLPFAWVSVVDTSQSSSIQPDTGKFNMYGIPEVTATITVSAPGFYSQVQSLENAADKPEGYDFQLLPQPGTRNYPWGSGQVIIPAETQVSLGTQHMTLTRGWLWGEAGDGTMLTISAAGFEIVLDQAKFALEFLPGEAAWLYLASGEASVSSDQSWQPVVMSGGQLLSLSSPILPAPVTFDPLTVQAFQTMSESPVPAVWEPSLMVQMKNRLTLLGVTTAQVITFITYLGVLLSLVGIPFVALQWWRKHKRSA
ncbi:MAG: carboxypeptidase-like regulatory domain-containing protein, partial [Chloroflexota bacterium]